MDLEEIRRDIDELDVQLLELFAKRMKLCCDVAEYKAQNGLPVFQGSREKAVLKRISEMAPEGLESASALLFSQIMDISKCLQQERLTKYNAVQHVKPAENPVAACPGIAGSYSEEACIRAFGEKGKIKRFDTFGQVFEAVNSGEADYGVVPIENSTAGGVDGTYDLLEQYEVYVCGRLSIPVRHVLAAKKGADKIQKVLSHEQALHQCSSFIKEQGLTAVTAVNTSIAAKTVADRQALDTACICSRHCAELYGLEILNESIADSNENYTRFIVISKTLQIPKNADTVSVCLSLPHHSGSLYRLLTRFSFSGLNLTKIESRPMPPHIKKKTGTEGFEFIFYLDFEGSVLNPSVTKLLDNLEKDCSYYRFLGNYVDSK